MTVNAITEHIVDGELINVIIHALKAIRDVNVNELIKYEIGMYPTMRAGLDPLRMKCINIVCKDVWKQNRSNSNWLMLKNVHKSVNDMIFESSMAFCNLPRASIRCIVYAVLPMNCDINNRHVYPCVSIRRRLVFNEWKVFGLPECPVKSFINGDLRYTERYSKCLKTMINEERKRRGLPPIKT